MDCNVCDMDATTSAVTKIVVPNFSKIFWDAIVSGTKAIYHKLPYADTPYYLYGLIGIGVFIVLLMLFWFWFNFIR